MNRVVFKETVAVADEIALDLPRGARLIHIGDQYGSGAHLTFWFTCDPNLPESATEEHRFLVFGTGHEFEADVVGPHRATVITAGGNLVWHVFSPPMEDGS